MTATDSLTIYQQRIADLEADRKKRKKKQGTIAWTRFGAVLAIVACLYYIHPFGWNYAIIAALLFAVIFFRLIVLSTRNNDYITNLDYLLQVNRQEISIAAGHYTLLPDGSDYLPPLHDYAHDLDVFGPGSLYQYFNRTTAEQGHARLAAWLLHPVEAEEIKARQAAVKELSALYEWRQQLQAHGLAHTITNSTQQRIEHWVKAPHQFSKRYWRIIRVVFPAAMAIAVALTLADILPTPIFAGIAFLFFIISGAISRKVQPVYTYLDKIVREIETLSKSIEWIERESFTSPLLLQHQQVYKSGPFKASVEVQALKNILERLELRLNPFVFIFLNTFLCWDLQQVLALEQWKTNNATRINSWFNTLGSVEALSSLAAIPFNHPDWRFPTLDPAHGTFVATGLGHPLIPVVKRVTSSFNTRGIAQLALVTGSNMAGKSTFLRSIGVNIVLAMAGAPVCASSCTMSPMRVISSMRISDNLQENTSTFYAELKKLKYIIEAVNNHEKVFLLLDEILRGTNSLDRQIGSKALISQLIRQQTIGMLATHDLELADLVNIYPGNIHNYHFDVQVENEELFFDYKLKEGVCKSLNASILMKKIGIEL